MIEMVLHLQYLVLVLARNYCNCAYVSIQINTTLDLKGNSRESLEPLSHLAIFHFALLKVTYCIFIFIFRVKLSY